MEKQEANGLEAEGGIEGISCGLALLSLSGSLASLACLNRGIISLARVSEPSADEAGDDVDVESGALAEVTLVVGGEGSLLTTVETLGELDSGVRARAKVKSTGLSELDNLTALDLGKVTLGKALILLSIAVRNAGINLARVGSIGTGVMLDSTGSLDGSANVLEGHSVGLKGAVGIARVADLGGSAAEVAAEGLEIARRRGASTIAGTVAGSASRSLRGRV